MADGNRMEKVDMAKEFSKLSDTDRYFIQKLEKMNRDRAKDIKILRRKNWFTALAIGTGVISIYIDNLMLEKKVVDGDVAAIPWDFYTIYAVRQERFLEDFDTVSKTPK